MLQYKACILPACQLVPKLYQSLSCSLLQTRSYRGRKTHNIGRTHGIAQKTRMKLAISDPNNRRSEFQIKEEFERLHQSTIAKTPIGEDLIYPDSHYSILNFTISGYDLVLVENFTDAVKKVMTDHKQDITEIYALPAHDVLLKEAETNTALLDKMPTKVVLSNYSRVVQVKDVSATDYPILLQILMSKVPQSVIFEVQEYTEEHLRARLQKSRDLENEKEALRVLMSE